MNQRLLAIIGVCAISLQALGACQGSDGSGAGTLSVDGGPAKKAVKPTIQHDAGIMAQDAAALPMAEGLVSEYLADAGDGWQSLIQAHWQLDQGAEAYRCARLTVTRDVAIREYHSVSPLGTHHTVLTVNASGSMPDGLTTCSAGDNAPGGVFALGVGTNDLAMPDGVAVVLHSGDQLNLNLHLFNVSDKPLEGTSGVLIHTIAQDQIVHVAEMLLAGTVQLNIPPGPNVVQSGKCTMGEDATVFAVGAHMHKQGVHLKAVAESSLDGTVVIHDADYSFDMQLVHTIDAVHMKKGDLIKVDCTYDNITDKTLHFGESTLNEMCFAGLLRYPAADKPNFLCTQ